MTAVVIAVCGVGTALVLAVWDSWRRALNAQVRTNELHVESMRRADYEAATKELARLDAKVTKMQSDFATLDHTLAVGRRR